MIKVTSTLVILQEYLSLFALVYNLDSVIGY